MGASRDLHDKIKSVLAAAFTAVAGNTPIVGPIIDTQDYGSAEFVIASAVLTDGTYTPSFEHGDDSGLSDTAAVAAGDLRGTIASATFALTDDSTTKRIGYKGGKRYVRMTITPSAVTTGGIIGAVCILSNPHVAPTA